MSKKNNPAITKQGRKLLKQIGMRWSDKLGCIMPGKVKQ